MNDVREALSAELEQRFPETFFKKEYRVCRAKSLFNVFADELLQQVPENATLSVDNGSLRFTREEVKPDPYDALAGDALSEYLKDQGPKDIDEFIRTGLEKSSLKYFLQ